MDSYDERLILGRDEMFLDEQQRSFLQFERESLRRKYFEFLNSARSETEMHYFFEANPIVLPGLHDLHNGPVGDVVISKLQLSNEFETDFAFICCDSATAQITLIEIESPTIRVFRDSDNLFTSVFNRTLQQIRDWSLWVQQNSTYVKDLFREIYFKNIFRHQRVKSRAIVVAGRRCDVQRNSQREKRWAAINQEVDPNAVMSYDRLGEILIMNPSLLQNLVCRPRRYISQIVRRRA